ncbi:hypothetical protein WT56_17530 [Burkholderia pseudomultivorans]|uniref:Uncharacterized protein n=1 Tax=Burkholderia pseudomultivorans TaxID=1207504 RepID=A0A132EGC1_9BURK|nr:hypothetical protein WT56_17530 [Burkholderia pseudomultivorans]
MDWFGRTGKAARALLPVCFVETDASEDFIARVAGIKKQRRRVPGFVEEGIGTETVGELRNPYTERVEP